MRLYLKPIDSFYFRGHNDFTPGENSAAATIFPPRPGTVYGALRASYIHQYSSFSDFAKKQADAKVIEWMGTPDQVGKFKMKGVLLAENRKLLFPLPLDYQVIKSDDKLSAHLLSLSESPKQASDLEGYRLTARKDGKSESSEGKYITQEFLKEVVFGSKEPIPVNPASQWVQGEHKVGIARNWQTKLAEEKMLYNLTKYSFKNNNIEFAVLLEEQDAPSFQEIPYVRLGGGNHPFVVSEEKNSPQILDNESKTRLIKSIQKNGIARLILITPAIWEFGTRPAGYDVETKQLTLSEDLKVDVLTAAIGRPVLIGGWDIQKSRPKARMNAVPSGSVLYVKVQPDQIEQFVETTLFGTLTDMLDYEGYGLTIPAAIHE